MKVDFGKDQVKAGRGAAYGVSYLLPIVVILGKLIAGYYRPF